MHTTLHKRPPPHHFTFKQSAACGHFSPSLGRIMDATCVCACVCSCLPCLAVIGQVILGALWKQNDKPGVTGV